MRHRAPLVWQGPGEFGSLRDARMKKADLDFSTLRWESKLRFCLDEMDDRSTRFLSCHWRLQTRLFGRSINGMYCNVLRFPRFTLLFGRSVPGAFCLFVFWTSGGSKSKVFNSHVIISGSGVIQAVYRKIHLFDVVSQSREMKPPTPAVVPIPAVEIG